jgi:2-dehydro-3-deoxyphosphogluconate aldolase/(4S)-4-hydroxy-2-oxoglutarate aldolase
MPIVTLDDAAHAAPLAQALLAGGIDVMEITLRTPAALDCIRAIAAAAPAMLLGAGTIRTPDDIEAALSAGAQFLVTPGLTPKLTTALQASGAPAWPGVATLSEAMAAAEAGFTALKLFPAEAAGGVNTLKAFAGPVADLKFCPTGGVSLANMAEYLKLPNVACVGGSWLTPEKLVRARAWAEIEQIARQSVEAAKA